MVVTLVILALSAVFFVSGKIRSDVVALCALVLLLLFHILTPDEALSGFSNSVVIMMIGLFVVGGAIFQTGLAKMISGKILQLAGKSETRLFILVMHLGKEIKPFRGVLPPNHSHLHLGNKKSQTTLGCLAAKTLTRAPRK